MPSTITISIRLKPRRKLFVLVAEIIFGVLLEVRPFGEDFRLERVLFTRETVAVGAVPRIDRHRLEILAPAAWNRGRGWLRHESLKALLGGGEIAGQHLVGE